MSAFPEGPFWSRHAFRGDRACRWNGLGRRYLKTGGRVALISEDFAREIAREPAAALGKRIRIAIEQSAWHEVIGVVQSVRLDGLYEDPPSTAYLPVLIANRFAQTSVAFAIRSERAGTASFTEEIRQAIQSVNGSIPIAQERTMQDFYAGSLARAIAVLGTLAYLAVQTHKNTEMLETQVNATYKSNRAGFSDKVISDPEFADFLIRTGLDTSLPGYEHLSPKDRLELTHLGVYLFTTWQWEFEEARKKRLPLPKQAMVRFAKAYPPLRQVWEFRKDTFDKDFQAYMDNEVFSQ